MVWFAGKAGGREESGPPSKLLLCVLAIAAHLAGDSEEDTGLGLCISLSWQGQAGSEEESFFLSSHYLKNPQIHFL